MISNRVDAEESNIFTTNLSLKELRTICSFLESSQDKIVALRFEPNEIGVKVLVQQGSINSMTNKWVDVTDYDRW